MSRSENIVTFNFSEDENINRDLWTHLVRIRANYSCERCGDSEKKLHAHHKDNNNKNNTLKNGECLCVSCHTKETWKSGKIRKAHAKAARSSKNKQRVSDQFKGIKFTDEHREKLRQAQLLAWSPNGSRRK